MAAELRGCVAVGQLQTFSAVFSYVEYNNLYSTYKKTAVQIGAWLLDCVAAGLRGCRAAVKYSNFTAASRL